MASGNHHSDSLSGVMLDAPGHLNVSPKTGVHASLPLGNHTPSLSSSPVPSTSTFATAAPSTVDPIPEHAGSAHSLLKGVQDESQVGKEGGSKRGSVFQRRSKGSRKEGNKQYVKRGLLMDSPTKEQATFIPRVVSSSMDVSSSSTHSDGIGENYEVVGMESEGGGVQASPPISVKSESLGSGGDGPTSSPDSGYGNTPDNPGPGGGEGHLTEVQQSSLPRARSGAIDESSLRADTQDSMYSMVVSSSLKNGVGPNLTPQQTTRSRQIYATQVPISSSSFGPPNTRTTANTRVSQDSSLPSNLSSVGSPKELDNELEQRSYSHMHPPQPPTVPPSLPTSSNSQVKRKRFRTTSSKHHFSKSSEMLRPSKSFSAHSNIVRDEKDYFQVTDELAQENSHFSLSDALLAVIEQYKANCLEQKQLEEHAPSLPPISDVLPSSLSTSPCLSSSPGMGEQPSLSSWGSMSSVATTDDPMETGGMARISLLELMQSQSCDHSAESVAQKLLRHMAGLMTGNLGENFNMSQLALKLPTEFVISLQMDEDLQKSVTTSLAHMRGSKEWAPPRRQIIYHIKQPSRNLQAELTAQGHRCTGCGMKVDSAHSRFFRFCNYVGKYFCQNCHTNATHIIPAHIIERWSFKKLPISNFARDLLTKMQDEPVFSINPVQHPIYKKIACMGQAKEVRSQLVSIRQYLRTCRHAHRLNQTFDNNSPWTTDLSSFSLTDFLELKSGVKLKQLKTLLEEAVTHVKSCPICQGRGFVCEFCQNSNDIIFPFESNKVSTCRDCRCCFHKECFKSSVACPRCLRIKERQRQRVRRMQQETEEEEEPPG